MRPGALVLALVLGACAAPTAPAPAASPRSPSASAETNGATAFDAARAKAHVTYLADPARGGRQSGSAGYADAAVYVAERFREIGLEPLGDDGTYFQSFQMPNVELAAMSRLARTGASAKTYRARVDFTESVSGRAGSGDVEATLAVVGGAARNFPQNDFQGASVKGKIALVTGPTLGNSVDAAFAEGAVGILAVGNAEIRYSYIPRFEAVTIPVLVITEAVANELIAPSGRSVGGIRDAVRARRADPSAPPVGFDVATTVRMAVALTPVRQVGGINVVGLLRGSDKAASEQAVLVGGHLDGVGTDPDGSIFQSANDNASGPAVAIEVARALVARRSTLKRSVVFAAFVGEEQGFFGSEAYAARTATSPGRVESLVAMIDLDVIGCCGNSLFVTDESPDLQRRIRDTATRLGVRSASSGGGGSDQSTFARRRVPAALIGWTDFILHTYRDTPDVVPVAKLKAAGDVVTEVTAQLASEG